MRFTKSLVGVVAALSLVTLSGCGGSGDATKASEEPSTPTETQSAPAKASGKLVVFAAASLNKAFEDIGELVKKDNPDLDITASYEGSSTLVDQLKEGAEADIFASADQKNMDKATEAGLVDTPQTFANNTLVLVTPKDSDGSITGLNDTLEGKRLVVCAPEVPCGNATKTLAENLGVTLKPVSEEQKVTDVKGKVESGEADAGLIYKTDAMASGDKVKVIEVPGAEKVVNEYPIAQVKNAKNPEAAKAFIDAVMSEEGQKILKEYGFTTVK